MTTKELKQSPDYWFTGVQVELFRVLEEYIKKFDSVKNAARSLNISRHYLSMFLNGDAPEKLSVYNFIALVIKMGYDPIIALKKNE